jgi:hypothetical protein
MKLKERMMIITGFNVELALRHWDWPTFLFALKYSEREIPLTALCESLLKICKPCIIYIGVESII